MDSEKRRKLKSYVEAVRHLAGKVESQRTAARIVCEVARDLRTEEKKKMKKSRIGVGDDLSKQATEKQLAYLEDLGVPVPEGLTKNQASLLIEVELSRKEQEEEDGEDVVVFRRAGKIRPGGPYVVSVEARESCPAEVRPGDVDPEFRRVV